ncbi:MAG: YncE family protein [Candidatus Eiseniibacteriota bacterium]
MRTIAAWMLFLCVTGCAPSGGSQAVRPGAYPGGGASGASGDSAGTDTTSGWVRDLMESKPHEPARGRGFLLVASDGENAVFFVDPDVRRVYARAITGWDPREIVIASNGSEVYVSNASGDRFGMGSISVISVDGRSEISRIDLYPYGRVHGLAVSRTGVYLYAACEERRTVVEVNLLSRTIGRTYQIPRGLPHMIALNETETQLYVTNGVLPLLHVIDLTSDSITEVQVGNGPEAVVFDPEGFTLWVANRDDGTVSVLDPYTLAVQAILSSGRGPVRIAFTRDGRKALVVNAGESAVAVFERMSRARIANIPVAGYPLGIAVDPNGRYAYVGSTRDDEISIIDLETNTVSGRIPVPPLPAGMLWVDTP